MRIKMRTLRPAFVGGVGFAAGSIIDVDPRTANDLTNEGVAELLDPREAPKLRDTVRQIYDAELQRAERSARAGGWTVAARNEPSGPWRKAR